MWIRFLKRNTTLRNVNIHNVTLLEKGELQVQASSPLYHFMEITMVKKLVRLLKIVLRKPKVLEMVSAIVLLGKSLSNNIRKDKNNCAKLVLLIAIIRSGRNLKPLKI